MLGASRLGPAALQLGQLRRRGFITVLGGAAVAWPFATRAQQAAMPLVGFLNSASPEVFADRLRAFHQGFKEIGRPRDRRRPWGV